MIRFFLAVLVTLASITNCYAVGANAPNRLIPTQIGGGTVYDGTEVCYGFPTTNCISTANPGNYSTVTEPRQYYRLPYNTVTNACQVKSVSFYAGDTWTQGGLTSYATTYKREPDGSLSEPCYGSFTSATTHSWNTVNTTFGTCVRAAGSNVAIVLYLQGTTLWVGRNDSGGSGLNYRTDSYTTPTSTMDGFTLSAGRDMHFFFKCQEE